MLRTPPLPRAHLGSLRLAPGKALDSKNATPGVVRFDGEYGPGGCGSPEIESHHARVGNRVHLSIAADYAVSAHKASNQDYLWSDHDFGVCMSNVPDHW